LNLGVCLLLLVVSAGAAGRVARPAGGLPANIHPLVAQQLKANPNGSLNVIVSKAGDAAGVEEAAEALGVRVTSR
jgi:hypothetical protein